MSDPDGEEPRRGLLVSITQGNPGIVTCHDGAWRGVAQTCSVRLTLHQSLHPSVLALVVDLSSDVRHGLQTGDTVTFDEVEGMTELNGSAPRPIKVRS